MNILDGKPPMMTHVFQNKDKQIIIAAKGGRTIIKVSDLNAKQSKIYRAIDTLASGYRILGVCYTEFKGTNTKNQKISLSFYWDWWFSMTRQSQYSTCNPAVL
jgi:Ca2+-transporting ATPase